MVLTLRRERPLSAHARGIKHRKFLDCLCSTHPHVPSSVHWLAREVSVACCRDARKEGSNQLTAALAARLFRLLQFDQDFVPFEPRDCKRRVVASSLPFEVMIGPTSHLPSVAFDIGQQRL